MLTKHILAFIIISPFTLSRLQLFKEDRWYKMLSSLICSVFWQVCPTRTYFTPLLNFHGILFCCPLLLNIFIPFSINELQSSWLHTIYAVVFPLVCICICTLYIYIYIMHRHSYMSVNMFVRVCACLCAGGGVVVLSFFFLDIYI